MRSKNQKLKLLYLAKIMQEKTDDTHALTMGEILAELNMSASFIMVQVIMMRFFSLIWIRNLS